MVINDDLLNLGPNELPIKLDLIQDNDITTSSNDIVLNGDIAKNTLDSITELKNLADTFNYMTTAATSGVYSYTTTSTQTSEPQKYETEITEKRIEECIDAIQKIRWAIIAKSNKSEMIELAGRLEQAKDILQIVPKLLQEIKEIPSYWTESLPGRFTPTTYTTQQPESGKITPTKP